MNLNINSSKKLQLRKDLDKPDKAEIKTIKSKHTKKKKKRREIIQKMKNPKKLNFKIFLNQAHL